MKVAAFSLLLCGCVAAPHPARTPVPFSDNPPISFQQARAICAPRAKAAAEQARTQAELQLGAQPNVGGYQRTAGPQLAAQKAGDSAYAGCLAEQGWRLQ